LARRKAAVSGINRELPVQPFALVRLGWEEVAAGLKVSRLSAPVQLLVPALLVSTLPRSTRGISFPPGKTGLAIGAVLVIGGASLGWLLGGRYNVEGALVGLWLLGSYGVLLMVSSVRPFALVKPICTRCRLLPIIKEHEAIHLTGVAGESAVWTSMRTRHSPESLGLSGDPNICWFCPIPKRLSEH
jgi:hypothetical protein